MDSNDFVQMMVVDSCFIVELLRLYEMSKEVYTDSNLYSPYYFFIFIYVLLNQLQILVKMKANDTLSRHSPLRFVNKVGKTSWLH